MSIGVLYVNRSICTNRSPICEWVSPIYKWESNICDSGWDFVPYGGFTNNPVLQVVFVENVKLMYFWLIASK